MKLMRIILKECDEKCLSPYWKSLFNCRLGIWANMMQILRLEISNCTLNKHWMMQ